MCKKIKVMLLRENKKFKSNNDTYVKILKQKTNVTYIELKYIRGKYFETSNLKYMHAMMQHP
jgi:hypothetical protein